MIRKYGALNEHDPVTCNDCERITDGTNVAIKQCQRGRDLDARRKAHSRATNPEIAAQDALRAAADRLALADRERTQAVDALTTAARSAHADGMPKSRIAEVAGVSRKTVYRMLGADY